MPNFAFGFLAEIIRKHCFTKIYLMTRRKKRKLIVSHERKMLLRWTMQLAHTIQEKDGLTLSQSMRLASLTCKLLQGLGKGVCCFTYMKENGEVREARGTLHRGIDPDFDNYKGKGKARRDNSNTEGIYTYWDLDRHAFRTFKAFNLIEY